MEAYFDNSATTIVTDSVKDIVVKTMTEDFGNPSAMHMVGVKAEKYIKEAQENIAKILKVDPKEIFFTSGGTESNNMAIIGTAMANKRKGNKIITTSVEHSSVLATMKYLEEQGFEVIYLPVDRYGVVQMEALEKEMTEDTILVSTMYVNNEVGAIEPVGEIGQYIKKVNPSDVYHINVFYINTGTGFTITDSEDIEYIVANIQGISMKRDGISLGRTGYSFKISYINSNDKDIIPVFILNSDNIICKDPFFYRCDGGLCFDYLKACEEKYRTNVTESIEEK